ncbi:CapA family protein [Candidatus Berkiella aquae]|uniref:CapA family protein n=1 Tax=Candidatus Berkiella aquae TaxID=295108 RepID=A0A0Q9YS32_9GAMM|nr:CapA family protein [Candidatus Berkiella aquae]MCS5709851.1 CapA family protein [Candidatus Berkiella aquae]
MKTIACLALLCFHCSFSLAREALQFPHACDKGKQLTIAAVGDLLFHYPLQRKAADHGFASLWPDLIPYFEAADITYGNLEGPIGVGLLPNGQQVADPLLWKTYFLSRFPSFNYHPSVAASLKTSGFDIVSNANNHILDRDSLGIDKTIETLDQHQLAHIGAKAKNATTSWYTLLERKGFKIAWLACAEHTNGIPDKHHQVFNCYHSADRSTMINTIRDLKKQVDIIIVSPHWGEEYQTFPNRAQKEFAKDVLNAGASAVIGSHPHVLQPVETFSTNDGRQTLISYSLGNFVSYQGSPKNRSSMVLLLGFTKTPTQTIINGVRFVPIYMNNRSGIDNIQINALSQEQFNRYFQSLYAPIIPFDHALFSLPIVTNPECIMK